MPPSANPEPRPADLLGPSDPDPVGHVRLTGTSPFVLACDHAGNAVPARLGGLGLARAELDRHIGVDIGALGVATTMSQTLDAPLVFQRYSRLVIDCNRSPSVPSSRPAVSDGTRVPGNQDLDDGAVQARVSEIFDPYHDCLIDLLNRRNGQRQPTVLVAVHSFTPRLRDGGDHRPWHIGVLFNRDERVGRALLAELAAEGDIEVGENQPYSVDDSTDYTIPVHGEQRGLPHVEVEIRQDLLATAEGQQAWAARLVRTLERAVAAAGVIGTP